MKIDTGNLPALLTSDLEPAPNWFFPLDAKELREECARLLAENRRLQRENARLSIRLELATRNIAILEDAMEKGIEAACAMTAKAIYATTTLRAAQ